MTNLNLSIYQYEENLTPQQKKFNRLVRKIDQLKILLTEWQQTRDKVQQDAATELLPAYSQWHQILFQQIEVLWQYKNTQKVAKTHLERLNDKIEIQVSQLSGCPNLSGQQQKLLDEIAEFYQLSQESRQTLHSHSVSESFENTQLDDNSNLLEQEILKELFAKQIGVPKNWIDFDFDPQDPDDFMQKVKEKFEQEEEAFIQEQLNDAEKEEYLKFIKKEKKKALKKKEKLEEAQKIAGQSLKSIYLKVASVIHPDREQDEQKRIQKTELLQQANQALENKDLLTLLKIRTYTESNDQQKANTIATEHLKSYNLLLEDQVEQLQDEIDSIVYSFDWQMSGFYKKNFKPIDLLKKYQRDLKDIENKLTRDQKLLEGYRNNHILKELLKSRTFSWIFNG